MKQAAVITAEHVHVTDEPARVGRPQGSTKRELQVELIREGDIVRAIDITCSCGERIRLRCDYE